MISHHHKSIFIHIPKCAGQSVEAAFLHDLGLTRHLRAPLLLRTNNMPELGPPKLAHLTASEYVAYKYITEKMFQDYYKFAIVRNPWSRAVSFYTFLDKYFVSFERFVTDVLPHRLHVEHYFFVRPQIEFLLDAQGAIAVDDIFRFENLSEDFEKIKHRTGLVSPLPRINTSPTVTSPGIRRRIELLGRGVQKRDVAKIRSILGRKEWHPHWRDYYDDTTRGAIRELYATDIERFCYTFE